MRTRRQCGFDCFGCRVLGGMGVVNHMNGLKRTIPRVLGVRKSFDNRKAVLLYFDVELTDEQLRTLQHEINAFVAMPKAPPPQPSLSLVAKT